MKRAIFFTDVWYFALLALITIALVVGVALTPQPWDWQKILILAFGAGGVVAVCGTIIYKRLHLVPTFVVETRHVYVWTNGLAAITPELMDKALTIYVKEIFDGEKILDGMTIEWRNEPIGAIGMGWLIKGAAGIQKGKNIVVQWNGSIKSSAFFHELMHARDELLYNRFDYKHEVKETWNTENRLNSEIDY